MKKLITICLLLTTAFTSQAQQNINEIIDDCPKPTIQQITRIFMSIYERTIPTEESGLGYKYQEDLYEMSCVDIKNDSKEVAYQKIRNMWNKYREEFSCSHFSGVSLPNANLLKFSIDVGFPSFLENAVKKYKLDMNFKDPINGETIMDFLIDQLESYKAGGFVSKVEEYDRIYKLLQVYGAKHAKDL